MLMNANRPLLLAMSQQSVSTQTVASTVNAGIEGFLGDGLECSGKFSAHHSMIL